MHHPGCSSLARAPLLLGKAVLRARAPTRLTFSVFAPALLAHLMLAPAVFASEWKPFGLQGTVVRSLAAAPDLLCAGTQGDGVHCLELGVPNARWRSLGPRDRTILWLWIDPLNPDVRFAAADNSLGGAPLYRTLDGGHGWEPLDELPVPFGGIPRVFMVDGVPGTPTLIAAGGHIWRTDDLGDSWSLLSTEGGLHSLEIAPTNPDTIWAGGETLIFMGFTLLSRDGGINWDTVWDSRPIGDNQTSFIAAHPDRDGLVLTGHEGFILRTVDHGANFDEVLTAPARFFIDWDGGNPSRAYGAGSPNQAIGHAFVSRDLGTTWSDVTGAALIDRMIFRLEADDRRVGVAYAATDDGVYRFYGGGLPLCLDTINGLDALRLWHGACPPILAGDPAGRAPVLATPGDAIAFDPDGVTGTASRIDLGEVECLIDGGDVALAGIDPPEPAIGRALAMLVRYAGDPDYGDGSDGLRRLPATGDCP